MTKAQPSFGLIGLGTMGAALALNIAEKGFPIAVFNRTVETTDNFMASAGELAERLAPTKDLESFVKAMARPRKIILMVPAGSVVDDQIAALEPLLDADDIIIDCGNANYRDTNRRALSASSKPWRFLGVGVSGGEEGARHGPSVMAGGDKSVWDQVSDVFKAISAKHTDGTPCAAWLGEAGAGHFVKMVHNGIEYADMQMIAEIYGILRDGHGWGASRIGELFAQWDKGPLKSYLVEITGKVAAAVDEATGEPLLDVILDSAGQKGTGRWTAVEAQHLGAPIPVIEAAVCARNMSARKDLRVEADDVFQRSAAILPAAAETEAYENALIAGKITCYAQGFAMISEASAEFGWSLPLAEIARIWRAGCIIRSSMLDDMASAFERSEALLVLDEKFIPRVQATIPSLREVVSKSFQNGHPVPALAAGLSWFDQLTSARSTADLIQGQRDFFGLHGFKRLDKDGDFHGPWAG